jgi:hypothetical protein
VGRANDEISRDSTRPANEPYCSNCGYTLTGAVESAKCPECGLPLVDVLTRPTFQTAKGKRWRSRARVRGMPAIDIAFGPSETETKGNARGFIAIGDDARGWLAIGGQARGVVAIGGMATGVFSFGGMSLGAFSFGGMSLGLLAATGGWAMGLLARGGGAVGVLAEGGMAFGYVARGGFAMGVHRSNPGSTSSVATRWFDGFSFFFGQGGPSAGGFIYGFAGMLLLILAAAILIAGIGLRAYQRDLGREV